MTPATKHTRSSDRRFYSPRLFANFSTSHMQNLYGTLLKSR